MRGQKPTSGVVLELAKQLEEIREEIDALRSRLRTATSVSADAGLLISDEEACLKKAIHDLELASVEIEEVVDDIRDGP